MNKRRTWHLVLSMNAVLFSVLTLFAGRSMAQVGATAANAGSAAAPGTAVGMGGGARISAPTFAASNAAPARMAPTQANVAPPPQARAQISTGTNAQSAFAAQNRAAVDSSARRSINGGYPTNRAVIQGNVPNGAQSRAGNAFLPASRLSAADLARINANQRNAQSSGRLATSTNNDSRLQELRRRHDSRNGRPFFYSNYFPSGYGYNGYGYGYGNSYNPYASYASGLSYGYPYTIVTTSGYGYPFYGNNYYDYDQPTPVASDVDTAQNPPAAENPQSSEVNNSPAPDSLVQDVQAELARRGYYAGKVDGIITTTFQTALRRFQTDQKLTPTGLLNQASLFALGLN